MMLRIPDYDPDEYPYECENCGTPVSELGMDPTGSRRCDDTDPDHRYHRAVEDDDDETRKDHDS